MNHKTILITGTTSGIGQALAKAFLSAQWEVIALSRDQASHATIEDPEALLHTYAIDLASPEAISKTAQEVLKHHPRIDWIVNNAGTIETEQGVLDVAWQDFQRILQVNTLAPYQLIQALWSALQPGEGGVINISSTAGLRGNPRFPVYGASKAALINLTDVLGRSDLFIEHKKKVINLIPGPTNTPMRERVAQDAAQQQSPTFIADWILRTVQDQTLLDQACTGKVILKKSTVSIESF